ncbi:hypothetical protein [Roseomonas indoligenes]|uniref:Uncharacterized protein n=1 Tax=Roseomonas indoligenes TaxID=2820811 RepID=A0A940MVG3_9PROT|nr:hypothetical protein [Pararoseomonas indoligenes]MBP0491236.1 hypothetical protein [Pararoseomonas indoligenes]
MLVSCLLAGCAGGGATPPDPAARQALARFDGLYQGQQIPSVVGGNCRTQSRTVWFRVRDGDVELRSSRRRHSAVQRPIMAGRVRPDGEIALNRDGSDRFAAGQIVGNRLTVTEVPPAVGALASGTTCLYRYEAERQQGDDEAE